MKTIRQTYIIKAPVKKVWKALTDPKHIEGWGAGPAKMAPVEGTKFSLWGADIFGTNKEVIPNKKLVQEWWGGRWDEPSTVTFELLEKNGKTKVELLHENLPNDAAKDIEKGWKDYYMGPLKKYVESKTKSP